jgi:hypothetical protein
MTCNFYFCMIKLRSAIMMPGKKYRKERGKHRWYDFSSSFANLPDNVYVVMHFFMVVAMGPLAHVSEVRCEGALGWGSILQGFPCLVTINVWVA